MEKEIKGFIITWNNNVDKVNGQNQTYNSLAKFCINSCRNAFEKFNLKSIILRLSRNEELNIKVKYLKELNNALLDEYHKERYKNTSLKRKFIYENDVNRGNEVVLKRKIEIKDNKISIGRVTQKEIDFEIVNKYLNFKKKNDFFPYNFSLNRKEKFIFYQVSLYDNNILRIKKWFDLLKKKAKKDGNIDVEDLNFLSNVYSFFIDYNKLDSEFQRLEFWFEKLIENKKFECFQEYFQKQNLKEFSENLIKLFKGNYYENLIKNFNLDYKKSISKQEFIKTSIKEFKYSLNKKSDGTRSYRGVSNHNDVYYDLIKGKREDYYNDLDLLKLAGETEAIQMFIEYLENQNSKNIKSIAVKDYSNSTKKDLLPIEIFDNTKGYLKKNAIQVNICYKHKAYDGCSILLRKITEVLIIELYEKFELEENIQDDDGNYFMLKKLIKSFQSEVKFKNILTIVNFVLEPLFFTLC